jgi:hypothetical protein
LGQAIGYALNNWAALARHLEQGFLAIDNNLSFDPFACSNETLPAAGLHLPRTGSQF